MKKILASFVIILLFLSFKNSMLLNTIFLLCKLFDYSIFLQEDPRALVASPAPC